MERAAKAQRLNAFRCSLPHMSQAALFAICKKSKQGEIPEIASRYEIKQAIDETALQLTPYGPVVMSIDLVSAAGPVQAEISNLFGLLHAASKCKMFAKLLRDTLAEHPCSHDKPWGLILYADEAKPGNKMKFENRRSLQMVYASFLEFGPAALAKEEFWLPIATMRSLKVEAIKAGMSQVLAVILKTIFDAHGHHLQHSGISLQVPHNVRLFATLESILGDESGLHGLWMCKGSGGVKCCIECSDVVDKNWAHADCIDAADRYKPFNTLYSLAECRQQPRERIFAIIDHLAAVHAAGDANGLRLKQIIHGFTYNEHGLLADPALRCILDPERQNTFDWSHNILQGIFQKVLWLTLLDISQSWTRRSLTAVMRSLATFLQEWRWPHRLENSSSDGKRIFTDKRIASMKEAEAVKMYSSEVLSLHSVIAHWIRKVILEPHEGTTCAESPHKLAGLALIKLSTLINILWYGPQMRVCSDAVAEASTSFMKAFADAFGTSKMIWKFHGQLHHSKYVARWGWSPQTLPLERKHKPILQKANDRANDQSMDGVLRDVVSSCLATLDTADWLNLDVGLINPKKPSKKLLSWLNDNLVDNDTHCVSAAARISAFECCHKNDLVAVRLNNNEDREWYVARVWFFGETEGEKWVALLPFSRVDAKKHTAYSAWREKDSPEIMFQEDILQSLIWTQQGDTVTVLHTLQLFGQ